MFFFSKGITEDETDIPICDRMVVGFKIIYAMSASHH
jgi:hypothetical protein